MLVSTVTAIISGDGCPSLVDVLARRAAAASIIALPPEACTLIIHAPVCTAASTACSHGVRDVVVLEVEKDARAGIHERAHERGALAGEQAIADLETAGDAA